MDSKKSSVMDIIGDAIVGYIKIAFIGGGCILALYGVFYFFESDADRLSNEYGVPAEKVLVEPKPHGCDFTDAPLGEKHCHFEKDVNVMRECGDPQQCKALSVAVAWRKVSE
jgi:hypothetical protein